MKIINDILAITVYEDWKDRVLQTYEEGIKFAVLRVLTVPWDRAVQHGLLGAGQRGSTVMV